MTTQLKPDLSVVDSLAAVEENELIGYNLRSTINGSK